MTTTAIETRRVSSRAFTVGRTKLALWLVLAYLLGSPFLLLLTKVTLNRWFMYLAFVGPFILFGAVLLLVGNRWKRSPLTQWVLLFGLIVFLQILNPGTSVLAGTVYFASKYLSILMYPIAILVINRQKDVVLFLKILALSAILTSLYSIFQEFVAYPHFEDLWAFSIGNVHGVTKALTMHRRTPGILLYSASNAVFMVMAALLALPVFLYSKRGWTKAILYLSFLGFGLLLTQTRGVWVGFAVGLLYFFWIIFRRHQKARFRILLVATAVGLALVVLIVSNLALSERILSFTNMFNPGHPFMTRVDGWKTIFTEYRAGLFFGYGTGSMGAGGTSVTGASGRVFEVADNMYLNVLFSFGGLGLIVFLAIFWQAYRLHRKNYLFLNTPFLRVASLAIVSSILAYAVSFYTGEYLAVFPANAYFWAALGVLSTLRYLDKPVADAPSRPSPHPV